MGLRMPECAFACASSAYFWCFVTVASDEKEGELIHKSTQDLWSFHKEGEDYVLERLFSDSGEPLKV